MTRVRLVAVAVAALTAVHLVRPPAYARRATLPDIVLITLDTTRADHLGPWGYFRARTPALDALAAESIVFDTFVVPMATTLPTHTSLFTGTEPLEHGVTANVKVTGRRMLISDQLRPLATWAAEQGWHTAGFVSSSPVKRGTGAEAGFVDWTEPVGSRRRAADTTDDAIDWLHTVDGDAILLWVHYVDPHYPWSPPAGYTEDLPKEGLDGWIGERDFRRSRLERIRDRLTAYDGEIRYMDEQLGRLVDALRATGRLHDALLVVAGDHGEGLGEHGHLEHGLVWHSELHAPLLMRLPGEAPRRVDTLVTAADVLPTVFGTARMAGFDAFTAQFSGHDVLTSPPPRDGILSMSSDRQLTKGVASTWALTTPEWKYVVDATGEQHLYDRRADPHERRSVLADHPEVAARLDAVVRDRVEHLEGRGDALGAGRTEVISPRLLRQLQEMGYLE